MKFMVLYSEETTIKSRRDTERGANRSAPRVCTPNRAVLEPILADLDRLWEMRHWIPEPGKPVNHSTIRMT